jgi:dienelactone hydrolase
MKYPGWIIMVIFCLSANSVDAEKSTEYSLPKPTGTYAVGTVFYYLTDNSREDDYTDDPTDFRKVSLRAWYPADPKANETPLNYLNKDAATLFALGGFVKPAFIAEVASKPAHSYLAAAVAKEKDSYPVLLFSASGVMDASALLAEDLASNGYIVFFIGHPHWCDYYFNEDGEIFYLDKSNEFYKKMWEEENSDIVKQTKEQLTRATTAEDKLTLQRKLNENMPLEISDIRRWTEDIDFIIDELEKMNLSSELFKGKLDLQRIGIMGYSKGGAAAGQACLTEKRCKAGINLSGFMFGDIGEEEMAVPFMVIESIEPWCQDCLPINDLLFHTSKNSIYMVQIKNATHANFSDLSAWGDYLTKEDILGSIDGRKFLKIQNDYVLQFFNKHLKGLPAPLLDNPPKDYPEVKFKSSHSK